jgi:hypothetical protein
MAGGCARSWLLSASAAAIAIAAPGAALAQSLPSGGQVTAGAAAIATTGSNLLVTQSSQNAIIVENAGTVEAPNGSVGLLGG